MYLQNYRIDIYDLLTMNSDDYDDFMTKHLHH